MNGNQNLILNHSNTQMKFNFPAKNTPNHLQIIYNGTVVAEVGEQKYLDLTLA